MRRRISWINMRIRTGTFHEVALMVFVSLRGAVGVFASNDDAVAFWSINDWVLYSSSDSE
jgi:hypothetical protein